MYLHIGFRKEDSGLPLPLSSFVRGSETVTCIKKFSEEVPDEKVIGGRSVTNPEE